MVHVPDGHSCDLIQAALRESSVKGNAKYLLVGLAVATDPASGVVVGTAQELAVTLGLSPRTVIDKVVCLVDRGLLEVNPKRGRGRRRYRVTLPPSEG